MKNKFTVLSLFCLLGMALECAAATASKQKAPAALKAGGVVLFKARGLPGYYKGSGTVIGPKEGGKYKVLTCAHCVDNTEGDGTFALNGKKYKITVESKDPKLDVAWCVLETKDTLPYALLAYADPKKGDFVWHRGHGVYTPGAVERGRVTEVNQDGWVFTTLPSSSGDSGAAIFDAAGRVVGIVCTSTAVPGPGFGGGRGLLGCLKCCKDKPGVKKPTARPKAGKCKCGKDCECCACKPQAKPKAKPKIKKVGC